MKKSFQKEKKEYKNLSVKTIYGKCIIKCVNYKN